MASRSLDLPGRIMAETLEGTIGKGATAEFTAFLKVQTQLPDLNQILTGKDLTYVPPRTDLKYALVSALAARAKGVKEMENCLKYSYALPKEFCVFLVTMMMARDDDRIEQCPSMEKWTKDHQEIVLTRRTL
ncbi:hypothetical protein ES703_105545 [subsurface metagenome]